MPTKTVIDCTTGKATEVELTPEEIAQADTDRAAAEVVAAAQAVFDAEDRDAGDFIRARIPGAVTKAKQIMAAPGAGTPTWTAAETRVILAALVLDLAARRTR